VPAPASAAVELLLAERAVLQTLYTYARTIDNGNLQEWLDCFEPDARWLLRSSGGPVEWEHAGHDQLAKFFDWHSHAPQRLHLHLTGNVVPEVSLETGQATVESYMVRLDRDAEERPYVFAFGKYHDTLRRGADGRWRFAIREVEYDAGPPSSALSSSAPGVSRVDAGRSPATP